MKFDCIKVGTHPRTGTHYLMSLIALNFTSDPVTYERFFWNHDLLAEDFVPEKDVAYITIFRDADDVMDSMWRLRARFGLDVDTYEEFLKTKYKDMYNDKMSSKTQKVTYKKKVLVTDKIAGNFSGIDLYPKEYYEIYKKNRRDFTAKYPEQFKIVQYENLKTDFVEEMVALCFFLGADLCNFKNINYKIGWAE